MVKGAQRHAVVYVVWTMPGIPLNVRRLKAKRHVCQSPVIAADGATSLIRTQDVLAKTRSTDASDGSDRRDSTAVETHGLTNRIMEGGGPKGVEELLSEILPPRRAALECLPQVCRHDAYRIVG